MRCSVAVFAHNEEANIGYCLEALLGQRLRAVEMAEILVVSSGSTDRTDAIVLSLMARHPRLRLLVQRRRQGKASAINLFLKHATENVCVLESGDTIPQPHALESLVSPLTDPRVGMTGAHPIPLNDRSTFAGHLVNLNWTLTHALAQRVPRLGEMVAFRRAFDSIPESTAVDEACIEALIKERGLEIRYIPDAVVHNRGPATVASYLKQCRRMYCGHLWLERDMGYRVSSRDLTLVAGLVLRELYRTPRSFPWTLGAVGVEAFGRLLGLLDFHLGQRNPTVWEMCPDTKALNPQNAFLEGLSGLDCRALERELASRVVVEG